MQDQIDDRPMMQVKVPSPTAYVLKNFCPAMKAGDEFLEYPHEVLSFLSAHIDTALDAQARKEYHVVLRMPLYQIGVVTHSMKLMGYKLKSSRGHAAGQALTFVLEEVVIDILVYGQKWEKIKFVEGLVDFNKDSVILLIDSFMKYMRDNWTVDRAAPNDMWACHETALKVLTYVMAAAEAFAKNNVGLQTPAEFLIYINCGTSSQDIITFKFP